jgi:membrane protease YdiL (CAAX protease family)
MMSEKLKFQLYQHPWLAMVIEHLVGIFTLLVVIVAANIVGVPGDAPYRPLITPTLAHLLVLFLVVPFILKLPSGRQSFREYLAEIRLTNLKPFFPLLGVGLSCSLLALFALSTQSLLLRIWQGLPISGSFLKGMIPIRMDLPPSLGYIISFPSIFEEISWRGVMLVLFRRKYSARISVLITALGFSFLHLVNLLGDVPANFVLRQVIMGLGFGLFYGYLVLRTDSLFPAMLFHFLVNMFIGSFTHYAQVHGSDTALVILLLVNIPLTTTGLILWVRFFSKKWLPGGQESGLSGWMFGRSRSSAI